MVLFTQQCLLRAGAKSIIDLGRCPVETDPPMWNDPVHGTSVLKTHPIR
ncbi:hypothetical protein [Legionella quinlivanii]|nr:hypothetical protein [Legionella quinlivanii]